MIPSALDGMPGLTFDAEGICTVDVEAWRKAQERFAATIEEGLASGRLEGFEPSVEACRSFRPFLFEVETRRLPFAKVQLAGPTTVRWVVRTHTGVPTSEVPELDQQLFRLSMAKGLALVKAVRRAGATPIIYLDEPGLYALERGNVRHVMALKELGMLVVALQREGALVGVHCCSNTDWAQVMGLGLDILSIDARLSLDAVLEEQAAWLGFLASGATLSLGIVPTDLASSFELSELCDSVEASLRATMPPSLSFEAVLSRMLLTPACGLGLRSVLDAEQIAGQVREAQKRLRAMASGRA
jgi:hypothetical protein